MAAGCLGVFGAICIGLGICGIFISFAGLIFTIWLLPGSITTFVVGLICCTIAMIGRNSAAQLKQLERMSKMQRAGNQWQQMAPPQIQPPPQPGPTPYPKASYGAPQRMSACPSCGWTMQHGPEVSGQVMVCGGCGQPIRLA